MRAPSRSRHPVTLAVALLALTACGAESPLDPAAGPSLALIGETPTLSLMDQALVVDVRLTRGIIEAQSADRFFLEIQATFTDEDLGDGLFTGGECPVVDVVKDGGLRRGELVPFRAVVSLAGIWDRLLAADGGAADQLDVAAVIELRLRDAAGGVHFLNRVTATASVDPKPTD